MNLTDLPGRELDLDALVKPDRVHRSVYTDAVIFELELRRIFGRAWLYIGHESQVPRQGDFVAAWMGRQPVIMIRHGDGEVHVLHNRCPHRGVMVVSEEQGNTGSLLRCPYHGWSFRTNGDLVLAPLRDGYPEHERMVGDRCFGMQRVSRVERYRGFVFASLAAPDDPLPALADVLGPARNWIDAIVDRAPEGEVDVRGGVHKYVVRGNWKLQLENLNDLYHPQFAHASSADKQNRQFTRRYGDAAGPHIDTAERGSSWDAAEAAGIDWGLSWCGPLPFNHNARGGPLVEAHRAALAKRHSQPRVDEIMSERFHNVVLYPSAVMQLASSHVRTIRPISPDLTEVRVYPIRLLGAPEEINRELIRYLNITHSAASLIQTDDVEMFRRAQGGLCSEGHEWVWLNRYMHAEQELDGVRRSVGTSELVMRNQYRGWLRYMREGGQ
jgi:phenylpropionate dioxygenase-like ring-hydroxylating dioxygenase large terminal subunit